ncbi:MAG: pyruvate kinase [Pseudomonadales bacterium]|nr:pyruvate kinase [Pseudomonadales bacterium]
MTELQKKTHKHETKIVATLGPSSDSPEKIAELMQAGTNVFRLNFSHGTAEGHIQTAQIIRECAKVQQRYVAILADLQGPKIRIADLPDGAVNLTVGDAIAIEVNKDFISTDNTVIGCDFITLPQQVKIDDILLLDDGFIQLKVDTIEGTRVHCSILVGGKLKSKKGINKRGGGLSAPSLTSKDLNDIKSAAKAGVDFMAVSFVSCAEDIHQARKHANDAGFNPAIIAKIERAELANDLDLLDDVIRASDGVMVARGDLAVEIGDAALVGMQKHIIIRARELERFVITATQMMESMINQPSPTRAEVMDVANAVLDGTDAVMLSAETAAGSYPVEAVCAVANICNGTETQNFIPRRRIVDIQLNTVEEAIATYAIATANNLPGVKCLVALTESGNTPLLMSRYNTSIPIYAFSKNLSTLQRTAMYRWVHPVATGSDHLSNDPDEAIQILKQKGLVHKGDKIVITSGDIANKTGGTNNMRIAVVS